MKVIPSSKQFFVSSRPESAEWRDPGFRALALELPFPEKPTRPILTSPIISRRKELEVRLLRDRQMKKWITSATILIAALSPRIAMAATEAPEERGSWLLLFFFTINFILFVFILGYFAVPLARKFFADRAATISNWPLSRRAPHSPRPRISPTRRPHGFPRSKPS